MSVRKRQWRDPSTGERKEVWMVDIEFTRADGSKSPRVRKVSPVQTKRGTEDYERQLRQSLLDGTYKRKEEEPKVVPTLAAFSEEFVNTYAVTNNKPSEVDSKRIAFRLHLNPVLGELKLTEIGMKQVERFKAKKLAEGLSPKTINNHLTMLRRLLAVAVEWGHLDHIIPIKWLKCPEPEFDFLSFDEADRLIEAAEAEWRAMIVVGLKAGLRQGELLALRWEDCDLVTGRILVRRAVARGKIGTPKSGKGREVSIGRIAVEALKAHRHLKGELVFSDLDGQLLTKGACKHPLWRAAKKAGLRRIGWHVLRHTFASHLVMRGAPLKAVQELMGHATIEMTMRYAHLSPDVRHAAARLLDSHGTTAAHDGKQDVTS